MAKVDLKILKPIPNWKTRKSGKEGHQIGEVLRITVDSEGTPTNRWWRDRLKDAEIDGCCEVIKKQKSTTKPAGDK